MTGWKGSMADIRLALLGLVALATACGPAPEKPAGNAAAAPSSLERAAIEAGVVTDPNSQSPIGLYRNRHEAGLDSFCIVHGEEGKLRFGLEAAFGEGIECSGKGTARLSGDKLILNFARSACLAVVQYDGDRVSFPGAMDIECRSLCTNRGSLEGVSMPRVSREESVARGARARRGGRLCE